MPSFPTWQEQPRYHFQITQPSPAHFSSLPHQKSWVLVLFMQQIYVLQLKDYEKQSRRMGNEEMWWKAHNHTHSGPKRTQGVASTAQTREEATLLMLIWLEECGLVEGSKSRDFGSHWTAVIRSAGRHNDEFMETKVTWDMHRPDLTQKTHQLSNECLWQSHFRGEEGLTLTLGKDHNHFYLWDTLFDKTCHRGLILKVKELKGNNNLGFAMSLSHLNHSHN